jgi:hypothetical protein
VIGSETWFPPPMLPDPEVVPWFVKPPDAEAPPLAGVPALAPPWHAALATPRIATAFPQRLTGTVMGSEIWFPPSTDPLPDVVPAIAIPEPESAIATLATPVTASARAFTRPPGGRDDRKS